jgi:UDP-GlcNAc:undecaprenyl-phosphate/decaprenyl-phosphate GlcNAc-1-phosphate transferase
MKATILFGAVSLLIVPVAALIMGVLVRGLHLQRENFRGESIPTAYGFTIVVAALPVYALMLAARAPIPHTAVFLSAIAGFGILGLVDDIYGTREAGGFRGHLGLLRQGRFSTGLLKAAVGGLLGLLLGLVAAGGRPIDGLVNAFVISLSANFLNLLDLRPGRAVSCFWVGLLLLVALGLGRLVSWWQIAPLILPTAWVTVLDRRARVMLGDAGSNALGAVLGLAIVYQFGLPAKLAALGLILAVNVYSEKRSISRLIESNRVLHAVDRLLGER